MQGGTQMQWPDPVLLLCYRSCHSLRSTCIATDGRCYVIISAISLWTTLLGLLLMLLRSFVDSKYQQRSAGYTCQHSQAAKGSELSSAASTITMTSQPSIRQASLITKTANARLRYYVVLVTVKSLPRVIWCHIYTSDRNEQAQIWYSTANDDMRVTDFQNWAL